MRMCSTCFLVTQIPQATAGNANPNCALTATKTLSKASRPISVNAGFRIC